MPARHFAFLAPALFAAALLALSGCDAVNKIVVGTKLSPRLVSSASPAAPEASPTPDANAALALPFDKTMYAPMNGRCLDNRVPVIMYHDVVKKRDKKSVWFDITLAEFSAQMEYLDAHNIMPISLDQLHRHLTRGEPIPEHCVVLTFDDNYQGFYDYAYPLLRSKRFPSAMFVHTNYVGDKTGTHPKMGWETLKELDGDGLVTIGSHTLSHPADMAKQTPEEQQRELGESKTTLETHLGHPVPYFAYPNGTGDKTTFDLAKAAGYTMAFTIENGPAEESPDILTIQRYVDTRFDKAFADCEAAKANAPAAVVDVSLQSDKPVRLQVAAFEGIKLGIVTGGKPQTMRAQQVRESVGEFVRDANAVAGMNGTFFADAAMRGTNNVLIGPSKASNDAAFIPEQLVQHLPKLRNRPLVLWNASHLVIVPFQPGWMNDENAIKGVLPDYSDVFLGGAWIVHDGQARTRAQMAPYAASDFNDPRRRACMGVTADGEIVLVGSLDVITTEQLAKAAAAAGVTEAVLVDSGFSTSVVFDGKIIVTGHTAKDLPSRPVPHAIVVTGTPENPTDEMTYKAFADADPSLSAIPAVEAQANLPHTVVGGRRHRGGQRRGR